MTTATPSAVITNEPDRPRSRPRPDLRWWREIAIALGFYLVYSMVRNTFGAGPESRDIAFRHARGVIKVERALGLWFEPRLQNWYLSLPADGFIRGWNIFYGTAHFFVTISLLVAVFIWAPERYRFLRTMLAGTTALALIGFATYTLMPPRLLDSPDQFGACADLAEGCHGYGLVGDLILGLLGGVIGGFLLRTIGVPSRGPSWLVHALVAAMGGIVLVACARLLRRV